MVALAVIVSLDGPALPVLALVLVVVRGRCADTAGAVRDRADGCGRASSRRRERGAQHGSADHDVRRAVARGRCRCVVARRGLCRQRGDVRGVRPAHRHGPRCPRPFTAAASEPSNVHSSRPDPRLRRRDRSGTFGAGVDTPRRSDRRDVLRSRGRDGAARLRGSRSTGRRRRTGRLAERRDRARSSAGDADCVACGEFGQPGAADRLLAARHGGTDRVARTGDDDARGERRARRRRCRHGRVRGGDRRDGAAHHAALLARARVRSDQRSVEHRQAGRGARCAGADRAHRHRGVADRDRRRR